MAEGTGFAVRLRALRESAGLTQRQLAEASGIRQPTVANLEQGRNDPSWMTVVSLAEALGVDCTAFLGAQATSEERRPRGRPRKKDGED